jgi:MSHA pilin protein MshC
MRDRSLPMAAGVSRSLRRRGRPAFFVMESPRTARGFTLIELIVTMIVVGILAFTVLPRFSTLNAFDAAGFADQVQSVIRYGQKTAIAQRRNVAVTYSTGAASICSYTSSTAPCNANCAGATGVSAVTLPGDSFRSAGSSTTMTGGTLCFDAVGRPYRGVAAIVAPFSIVVNDGGAPLKTIVIEQETGYVR